MGCDFIYRDGDTLYRFNLDVFICIIKFYSEWFNGYSAYSTSLMVYYYSYFLLLLNKVWTAGFSSYSAYSTSFITYSARLGFQYLFTSFKLLSLCQHALEF